MKPSIIAVLLSFSLVTIVMAQPYWNSANGPEGGDVSCFLAANGQLYAGTWGGGAYRSSDQGDHWHPFEFMGSTVHTIAVNDSGQLFVGLQGDGIFRRNADSTWTRAQQGILYPTVRKLCFDPGTRNLYAQVDANQNVEMFYRSTNNGNLWTAINTGLQSHWTSGISVAPNGYLYCASADSIYRSINHGDNWSFVGRITNGSGGHFAFSGDTIYTGSNGAFRSVDFGQTWSRIGDFAENVLAMGIAPNGTLYIGTYYGVYRWQNNLMQLSGLSDRSILSIVTFGNDVAFAGTPGFGAYKLQAGNWNPASNGLTCSSVQTIAIRGHDIYCSSNREVFQLAPATFRWISRSTSAQQYFLRTMAIGTNGELFAGTSVGVIRSTNEGIEWSAPMIADSAINTIATAPMGNLYAGTDHCVYRSTDNGQSWVPFNARTTGIISSIHVTPTMIPESWIVNIGTTDGIYRMLEDGRNWTFIGFMGYEFYEIAMSSLGVLYAGVSHGVLRSLDQGLSWQPLPIAVPTYSVVSNSQGTIFAATSNGIYYSRTEGSTWDDLSHEGLLNQNVIELKIDYDSYLWAATLGNGVFVSFHPTNDVHEPVTFVPAELRLHQNYPNPFNASSTISYSLPKPGKVTLQLFDITGREVYQKTCQAYRSGEQNFLVDGTALAAGLYYYRVSSGEFSATRKMVLLK
ncbi:MAG: T9SS type A sorting domain-containing protein [bacterium]|nr:T9SS type A sorting domain-containing protein [bacterium]